MPTRISPSRPRRFTGHRLRKPDRGRTLAMELLALNSAHHCFTLGCSLELGSSPAKPLAIWRDGRFHSRDWGDSGEVRLPDYGLSEKQRECGVHSCLQLRIPSHARSLLRAYPAPCGSALFCFGYAALRVTVSTFGGPTVNAELGTWEPG